MVCYISGQCNEWSVLIESQLDICVKHNITIQHILITELETAHKANVPHAASTHIACSRVTIEEYAVGNGMSGPFLLRTHDTAHRHVESTTLSTHIACSWVTEEEYARHPPIAITVAIVGSSSTVRKLYPAQTCQGKGGQHVLCSAVCVKST